MKARGSPMHFGADLAEPGGPLHRGLLLPAAESLPGSEGGRTAGRRSIFGRHLALSLRPLPPLPRVTRAPGARVLRPRPTPSCARPGRVSAESRASQQPPRARGGGRGCNLCRRPRGGATAGSVRRRVGPTPLPSPHGAPSLPTCPPALA